MAKAYEDQYTWRTGIKIPGTQLEGIEHVDGSVSIAFVWDGYQTELADDGKVESTFLAYSKALQSITSHNVVFENHFLREFDNRVCQEYLAYGQQKTIRHESLSQYFRQEMAETIGDMAMENRLLTVATLPMKHSPLAAVLAKKQHQKNRAKTKELLETVNELTVHLPGVKFLTAEEIEAELWRNYHRDRGRNKDIPSPNPRFPIHQRLARKPIWDEENRCLRLGQTYTKVCLVLDYPDAKPNWFYQLANRFGCEVQVTQIFQRLDTGSVMFKSSTQTKKALESAGEIGGENEQGKIRDHNDFRSFVSDNGLALFNNCFILKLHHTDPEFLNDTYHRMKANLGGDLVVSDDNEEVAFAYWRVSQPGQGYRSPFLRDDHTLLVANMAPVITFKEGDTRHRDNLRITSDAKAVTFGFPPDGTNHMITAAKTGSGKGVENVAKICELYPTGTNFYITEVGASYKWVVEAFGGDYFHLDPNTTVISPFPDFKLADASRQNPLDSDIVSPTIGALMPLLARGSQDSHHISSVGEQIMQAMYGILNAEDGKNAPSLADYLVIAQEAKGEFSGAQRRAAEMICENLDSFLSSTAGSNFERADSLNFDAGIVGVDFKKLMDSEELAKFLLVFITLRFKQLAFANSNPVRIQIDELHEFVRIDRALMETLTKQLTRMGRKEAGAYHGISQETMDSALEPGILNQITHREFMYLQSGHKDAAELYRINGGALARWQSYSDPEAAGTSMDFRQCLRMVGDDVFDLHLTFPQSILDLAHSSPRALKIKEQIGKITTNPIERLQLFRKAMEEAQP